MRQSEEGCVIARAERLPHPHPKRLTPDLNVCPKCGRPGLRIKDRPGWWSCARYGERHPCWQFEEPETPAVEYAARCALDGIDPEIMMAFNERVHVDDKKGGGGNRGPSPAKQKLTAWIRRTAPGRHARRI